MGRLFDVMLIDRFADLGKKPLARLRVKIILWI
jgi:hypothetical protein